MPWPIDRPRRLRENKTLRNMVSETSLSADDFIYPMFIVPGRGVKKTIGSLAGQFHLSPDEAAAMAESLWGKGLKSIILFGLPATKDPLGASGADPEGPVPLAVWAIKKAVPELLVVTDVCLCEYTSHGHCGPIVGGRVDNDGALPLLAGQALVHAQAGADLVAPSDMMDGRVKAIRGLLDDKGFSRLPIMAYSAKYASGYYGPFREAAGSAPQFGDRRAYQMNPANRLEALREIDLDVEEGADIVMVKPAGPYLDIIREAKNRLDRPLAAYQVSGEYAMIVAAGRAGLIDEERVMMESLVGIKRAGADLIISYFTPIILERLSNVEW